MFPYRWVGGINSIEELSTVEEFDGMQECFQMIQSGFWLTTMDTGFERTEKEFDAFFNLKYLHHDKK